MCFFFLPFQACYTKPRLVTNAIPKYANPDDPERNADASAFAAMQTHKRVLLDKTHNQQIKKPRLDSNNMSSLNLSSPSIDIVDETVDMSGIELLEDTSTTDQTSPTNSWENMSSFDNNSSSIHEQDTEVNNEPMDECRDALVDERWFTLLRDGIFKIDLPPGDWTFQPDKDGICFMYSKIEKTPTRKQNVTRTFTKKVRCR